MITLRPAALAFEAVAPNFDDRFAAWQSVAAQRRVVRRILLEVFPPGGRIFEVGGGTGEDAAWLAERNFKLLLTDASPAMVERARTKLSPLGSRAEVAAAEELDSFAEHQARFDGAFSNFAPLNCVEDLSPVGRGLARLLKQRSAAILVVFGTMAPGEILVEGLCRRPERALRRFRRDCVPAQLGGSHFAVHYHRRSAIVAAMQPWFRLVRRLGIGVFVPPSAAEPWISRHPRLLACLEKLDQVASRPLAIFGDHVLYHFERTAANAP